MPARADSRLQGLKAVCQRAAVSSTFRIMRKLGRCMVFAPVPMPVTKVRERCLPAAIAALPPRSAFAAVWGYGKTERCEQATGERKQCLVHSWEIDQWMERKDPEEFSRWRCKSPALAKLFDTATPVNRSLWEGGQTCPAKNQAASRQPSSVAARIAFACSATMPSQLTSRNKPCGKWPQCWAASRRKPSASPW